MPPNGKWVPEHLEWRRETFLFPVLPGWDLSIPGKARQGIVLPDRGIKTSVGGGPEISFLRTGVTGVLQPGEGTLIPANRVVTHFGFFCRQELELEKTIRLPLRIRLGSLEYCNRLEGK